MHSTSHSTDMFADKTQMQHRLFSELSRMFGSEVPLYDKALLVNQVCNRAVCQVLEQRHPGFSMTDEELERTSGERHGAIRIGRPDEYRWVGRFFAQFAMEPHNFYDMTSVGAKSQPIIATAFRSRRNPEHRVFTSLLQTICIDPPARERVETLLARRRVFSDEAKRLIEKGEEHGGLSWTDANALIKEGTERIFRWTGRARDHGLYKELSASGLKIAADMACFESHHLNHLTPNTLWIDLYTSAMKLCMGELSGAEFVARGKRAMERLTHAATRDWLRLHFKHVPAETIDGYAEGSITPAQIAEIVERTAVRLLASDLSLNELSHAGFKDTTEGPTEDTPVLLRQDSYKALTEPVEFVERDGSIIKTTHTARFGEVEQRFYATTRAGRTLYDECLAEAERLAESDPGLVKKDFAAYQERQAKAFARFPKTFPELLARGLVYGRYSPTAKGLAMAGSIGSTNMHELARQGLVRVDGLRYEDFLPVSAAGIFASNLQQYGTKSSVERPVFTQAMLEDVLGRPIIDTDAQCAGVEAESMLETYQRLGVLHQVEPEVRAELARLVDAGAGESASVPAMSTS
jgi:uncharacterized glyoxalase superfamily metalloenzyme YdcJ